MPVKGKNTSERSEMAGGAISRRFFLAISGATALTTRSGASIDPGNASRPAAADGPLVQPVSDMEQRGIPSPAQQAPWYARMRRCGQINFNERDPVNMNVEAWADYWASLKVDAVLLNGGGILAFYPTDVPYHHRSQFLGTRDLFGEMLNA